MFRFYLNRCRSRRLAIRTHPSAASEAFEISVVSSADEIRARGFVDADTPVKLSPAEWAALAPALSEIDSLA